MPRHYVKPYVAEPLRSGANNSLRKIIGQILPMLTTSRAPKKSWEDIRVLLEKLYTRMQSDNFRPDITVAVGREGALIGSLLAVNWRLKPFVTVDRDFSFNGQQQATVHDMLQDRIVQGKTILLIDCEVNSGATMREVTSYLLRKGARSVRTMALARQEGASFQPDYTGFTYRERAVFPWEFTQELREIRHVKSTEERR